MSECNVCFFDNESDTETLHNRLTLSESLIQKAISRKDELIDYLSEELKATFECDVKFWLQGSYKSHTQIKPPSPFETFDIDLGIKLMFDAESEDIDSLDVKEALRSSIESYTKINNEAKLLQSKNSCETLEFPNFLTIDTPIYCISNGNTKLATNKEWIDSDPKKIQEWLTNTYSDRSERAQLKRVIRYLKAWANIKWQSSKYKKAPSLALSVLAADNLVICKDDDDSFTLTCIKICESLATQMYVKSPISNDNLLSMDYESEVYAHQMFDSLYNVLSFIKESDSISEKALAFSNLFAHYFPQIEFASSGNSNLPALTTVPRILVNRYDQDGNHIKSYSDVDSIRVSKGDQLKFQISNPTDFDLTSKVNWTVRNTGKQANNANDYGHIYDSTMITSIDRDCSYTGQHFMECVVLGNDSVLGVNQVTIRVKPKLTGKKPFRRIKK